ncbi:TonB-dependent receptor [Marinoscillum furvescens]|uniref:TonB-dependent receptor-like protein n=1 Tax=Marinoscillum furvescens DSM 4134 TaxID=1122208 RepID=A0A3D9LGW9_MARFU|nr:TonB-dependent receptor [Marinoscillum furvescens]REE05641.1 TonB-dependent receptor-like protein [Marinoscillum furvescens DSM 4134]
MNPLTFFRLLLVLDLMLYTTTQLSAQNTQTVRGRLIDQDAQTPLIGATIQVLGSSPIIGSSTDTNGAFKLTNVPLGRITLLATYLGYEDRVIPNVLVSSGKEVVLEISLLESVENLDAVVVAATQKSEVLNEMALISARTFSVEETKRYAGALSDPARMVSGYAGVTGNAEGNNDIVVRGNSPRGILWRLEGVEIPNPNHFANEGATGGPINALNSNMLDNSDFFSGAFAPEYGNALSGVFDMRFKKGNNETREYTAGASVFGIDFAAEGPFTKGYRGSYIANYRYSSLQLIADLGFLEFGGIPKYQDASFNVALPLGKNDYLTTFGLGGISEIAVEEEEEDGTRQYKGTMGADLGILGVSHTHFFGNDAFIKNTLSVSATALSTEDHLPDNNNQFRYMGASKINKTTYRLASTYNLKLNARHKLETGTIGSLLSYNAFAEAFNFEEEAIQTQLDDEGNTYTLQAFASWKYRPSSTWTITSGLHTLYYGLNGSYTLEPRIGARWDATDRHHFTLGAGLHSRLESITSYLAKRPTNSGTETPNKHLKPTKALHLVGGYGLAIGRNTHLKAELYYQHLYDVPVVDDPTSHFSLLNSTESFETRQLVNEGTGRNFGLELTLERYFAEGFYYMLTASVYESFYTAKDGVERNTAFNGNYATNFLAGKEMAFGNPDKRRTFFVNTKISLLGGARYTPIDLEASRNTGDEVRNEDKPWSEKGDDIFFINLAMGIRRDKRNTTREFKIDISNVTNHQGIVNEYYQHGSQEIIQSPQLPFLPNIAYMIKF